MQPPERGRSRERFTPNPSNILPPLRHSSATPPSSTDQGWSSLHLMPNPYSSQQTESYGAWLEKYTPTYPNQEMGSTMSAHLTMKAALMSQSSSDMDSPFARRSSSAARSDTSMCSVGSAMSCTSFKSIDPRGSRRGRKNWTVNPPTGTVGHVPVPKFERTYTDIAVDNFYDPSGVTQSREQIEPWQSSLLSPSLAHLPTPPPTSSQSTIPSPSTEFITDTRSLPSSELGTLQSLNLLNGPFGTVNAHQSPFLTAYCTSLESPEPPGWSATAAEEVPLPDRVSSTTGTSSGVVHRDSGSVERRDIQSPRSFEKTSSIVSPYPRSQTKSSRLASQPRQPLFCTWPDCSATFRHKYEWARHEEAKHYLPYHWICCLDDGNSRTRTVDPCLVCDEQNASLQHIKNHDEFTNCAGKDTETRTFLRQDHLTQHIKGTHFKSQTITPSSLRLLAHAWRIDNPSISQMALHCGFCGTAFMDWEARKDHVYDHLRGDGKIGKAAWRAATFTSQD